MSGIILGPPNYHDYQNQLHKLHTERFSRMPFDMFKSRVKIVREEAVVKKWIEDQSFKTEYTCLNVPEATTLNSREEVEKHFREVHLPNVIKQVEKHSMSEAKPVIAVAGTATHRAHGGGPEAVSVADCDHPEPAICVARPAILQNRDYACDGRAPAF
jgi:hypothetical protein